MQRNSTILKNRNAVVDREMRRFRAAHEQHYASLKKISRILLSHGIRFKECYRGRDVDYTPFDLVITVGGDGTFLEAARRVRHQIMLGVNSAPDHSVGRLCAATTDNFENVLKLIFANKFEINSLARLQVKFEDGPESINALNDILICHRNPAVLCRYYLKIKERREEQRSSGIWISTPAGSTGAIHSAGGKVLAPYGKEFQYKPRELYPWHNVKYTLSGGLLHATQTVSVTSLMRGGMVFFDGAHQKSSFLYGATIKVSLSPQPIKTIKVK